MRLNLGCGDRYVPGWHNVDWGGCPFHVDEIVDLTGPLPWEPGTITHIYMGHLLEHLRPIDAYELVVALLPLAAPAGGLLMSVGPDARVAKEMAAAGTLDTTDHSLDGIIYGDNRWPGTEHQWETTGMEIAQMMQAAGWMSRDLGGVRFVSEFWPVADRRPQWQYAVRAYTEQDGGKGD